MDDTGTLVWGWPGLARKAHVFPEGGGTALCGRWLWRGPTTPLNLGESPGADDCAPCWRKAKARA